MASDVFRKHIRMAAERYRLERLANMSWKMAWTLAGALLILLLLSLTTPVLEVAMWGIAAIFVISLGVAAFVYYRGVDRHRLFVRMDAQGKLPDSVLSSGDWEEAAASDPWRARQRSETAGKLEKIDWRQAWQVKWPRLLWLPMGCSVLLAALVCVHQAQWVKALREANKERERVNAAARMQAAEQLKPLEQVFKDWDEAQKIAPSPEMAELLKAIKPMRDDMASGKLTEKQLLLKMNEVQARVQAAKDKLDAESLEPMAKSLADAVKDLDGMSGLAAALQRKDFAAAHDQAAQAQEKYQSGAAKMPEGDKAQAAASRMSEAAQKAANDAQASSSLSQMQDALGKKDASEMGKGLEGLKASMAREGQRQAQSKNLGMQLAQLGDAKDGMGKGSGMKLGMPQLSLAKSLQEQKGAGNGSDPNHLGPQTQLDANHQEMKITGTAGTGASETHTESTEVPHAEQTAASVNDAQFAEYEKLSEQATQDENLPVSDRQMIKRYFEDIRPQTNP
jgi:hypothetical protein